MTSTCSPAGSSCRRARPEHPRPSRLRRRRRRWSPSVTRRCSADRSRLQRSRSEGREWLDREMANNSRCSPFPYRALPAFLLPVMDWHLRDKRLRIDRPLIMGIVNVTPDSFSDGGRVFSSNADILAYAGTLLDQGADILDVGGESTRPGASAVSEADEMKRVLPVVEALAQRHPAAIISVDTLKSTVARAAL